MASKHNSINDQPVPNIAEMLEFCFKLFMVSEHNIYLLSVVLIIKFFSLPIFLQDCPTEVRDFAYTAQLVNIPAAEAAAHATMSVDEARATKARWKKIQQQMLDVFHNFSTTLKVKTKGASNMSALDWKTRWSEFSPSYVVMTQGNDTINELWISVLKAATAGTLVHSHDSRGNELFVVSCCNVFP